MSRIKQPSYRPHPYFNLESQEEWEFAARQLLDEGQAFLACDMARKGLESFPQSRSLVKSVALGLIRVGAPEEARSLLEPFVPTFGHTPEQLRQVYEAFHDVLSTRTENGSQTADSHALAKLERFVGALHGLRQPLPGSEAPDEEAMGMLARIYKDQWRIANDPALARRSRDIYRLSYEYTGGYYTGINAAAMSLIIGETSIAQNLAQNVYARCQSLQASQEKASQEKEYWLLATMGEALLLLNRQEAALQKYREAANLALTQCAWIVSSLQQIRLLQQHGVGVPDAIHDVLKPPEVVVFVGHMVDGGDRPTPRFPAHIETRLRAAIDRSLQELNVRIGYCSAACGSDILFIEAMLARGAEVNIVLPFAEEDFLRLSVAFAGDRWLVRYKNALKQAHSVSFLTEEPYLGDAVLFGYLARVFHGYAELRASTLLTQPRLLAVWDGNPNGGVGGTADFVSQWPDPQRQSIIRLDHLLAAAAPAETSGSASACVDASAADMPEAQGNRCIKTLLFADVTGYSRLDEARIPAFLHEFWSKVAQRLNPLPSFINTWGDAIFVVMDSCLPMMKFALALQSAVETTPWEASGVPKGISIRIGLHVGPIFEAVDPLTGRANYYGSHVNRAARLEPVTLPGHIYATEPFVALMMSEMSALRAEAEQRNERAEFPFVCEYVGILSLAKDFGRQAAYHVRRG